MGNTPLWTLKRDRKKPNDSKEMRGSNRSIAFQNIPNQHSGVLHFGRVAIGPLGTHKGLALSQLLQPFAHKHPELEGAPDVTLQVLDPLGSRQGRYLVKQDGFSFVLLHSGHGASKWSCTEVGGASCVR